MNNRIRSPLTPAEQSPLLLLLHGKGADENDLFALARYLDPRFTIISLRAPHEMAPGYYRWYERFDSPQGSVFDEAEISLSRLWLIQQLDEALETTGADPTQVHLLGFSQGGAMALALALTVPQKLRSVVSIAGRLLPACAPHAAPPSALQHLDLLIQHGHLDDVVPHTESLEAGRYFTAYARSTLLKTYAAGHTISPAMLKDAIDFLRNQLDSSF